MKANTRSERQHKPTTTDKANGMVARDAKEPAPFEIERRLMEEINILKLEGALFCFDPREAKRRRGALILKDALKRPITVRVHPDLGQPSVLAYKVLQAIFLKLTEQGCEPHEDGTCHYNDTVHFSQRELARLVGRTWGTSASEQLYNAIKQLRLTDITAHFYDKKTKTWSLTSFAILPSDIFSGHDETITRCVVRVAPEIIASLNRRHVAIFNLNRLNQLDTIGLAIYKHAFFHLSNLMHDARPNGQLKFTKDYDAICTEWLGSIKSLKHRSRIINDQLGRHFDGLVATGLIRRYTIEKNKAGDGFNITFYPGKGFFEDYETFYIKQAKPRRRPQGTDLLEVKALELVAHFHRALGRTTRTRFADHETAYADELLTTHTEEELRDLIAYAIGEARKTRYEMLFFGALKSYLPAWGADRARQKERQRRAKVMADCPICNGEGVFRLKEQGSHQVQVHLCPHRLEAVTDLEDRLKAYRV